MRHHCQRVEWSPADLAAAIHRSTSQVSRYLTGDTQMGDDVTEAIATALTLNDSERCELRFLAWLATAHADVIKHLSAIEARAAVADLCEAKVRRAKQYLDNLGEAVDTSAPTPPDHHRKVHRKPSDTDQWMGHGKE